MALENTGINSQKINNWQVVFLFCLLRVEIGLWRITGIACFHRELVTEIISMENLKACSLHFRDKS